MGADRAALAAAALLLAAPAFAQSSGAGNSAYVRARIADAAGLAAPASAGYSAALAADPNDEILAMRAYRHALAAGDYNLASRAAAVLVRAGTAPPDTALLAFAIALKTEDRKGTEAALARMSRGPLNFLLPVLEAWVTLDRREDPMPLLAKAQGNALAMRFAGHHRALLLIATGQHDEAVKTVAELLGEGDDDLRIDAAALFTGMGQRKLADMMIPGDRLDYARLRKQMGKGIKPNAAFGASRLFLGVAEDIAAQEIPVLSILLTRAALLLDPADDRARLYLAEALSQSGATAMALAELGKVSSASPYRRGAQVGMIAAHQRAGQPADALPLAKALAAGPEATSADERTYGDVLSANTQYAAAATAYGAALGKSDGDSDWELHYLHGSALDRAGAWSEALPALQRAVALGPDQPTALEYLGYAQVLRGENLPEAQELLERANKLKPDDPGISASLAWAYFTRGDVERAVPLLENAVQGDPNDAITNEHLGDAYWRLGRHYEARYAWSAAVIQADNDAVRRIEDKLAKGL
ncbi:MAG: tetratricopeptide repeat protein [Sphingomonadales bacterium]|nr:MAG: tetratricopeptide repeat protein [Sphingomonadales bacterium]